MVSEKMYKYIGRNGSITSPVLLENIAPILMKRLMAGEGKMLTNGRKVVKEITVFDDEVSDWYEIEAEN